MLIKNISHKKIVISAVVFSIGIICRLLNCINGQWSINVAKAGCRGCGFCNHVLTMKE